jgi:hypothetical protein
MHGATYREITRRPHEEQNCPAHGRNGFNNELLAVGSSPEHLQQ